MSRRDEQANQTYLDVKRGFIPFPDALEFIQDELGFTFEEAAEQLGVSPDEAERLALR